MKQIFLTLISVGLLAVSCKKEFDSPPKRDIPSGSVYTLSQLRQLFKDSVTTYNNNIANGTIVATPRAYYKFTGDYSAYCTVTADEKSGNLYKNVYVTDGAAALNVGLIYSGGLYTGDSVRIYLKNTILVDDNGMLILDSVNVDENVIKQQAQVNVTPIPVTLAQLDTSYESRLIILNGVELISSETGTTWADAIGKSSVNHTFVDCDGRSVLVRTSGYSSFAGTAVATGNGHLIATVGEYKGTLQLYVRNTTENVLNNSRCSPAIIKDFEDESITSGGWQAYSASGAQVWSIGIIGGAYAVMSGYANSVNNANEDWLISPAVDVTGSTNAKLTFKSATKYTGNAMQVLASTDYSGSGDPNAATWSPLSCILSAGNFVWIGSGDIALSPFNSSNLRIAVKYTCTTSAAATWEVDDIIVSVQ